MLNDLAEIISIQSIMDNAEPGAPFGKNLRKALDWFLAKAESYGLRTAESGGYCGWAECGPEGAEMIGVLCHIDVVPVGPGWTSAPFCMTELDGKIYGRGVVDNKGPLVAVLHALKRINESGVPLKRRIRMIVGCNEENGSACIEHYVATQELPGMSFVPDADFPLINSEKGILHAKLSLPLDTFFRDNIAALSGGQRPNVVPDSASVTIKKGSPLYEYLEKKGGGSVDDGLFKTAPFVESILSDGHELKQFFIENTDRGIVIETAGIAGHAMDPEKGDNAIFKIFCLFDALRAPFPSPVSESVYEYLCSPLAAEKLGIACMDEKSGDLTINPGMIRLSENALEITLDMRLPLCADHEDVQAKILAKMPEGTTLEVEHWAPNLYIDENSELVKILLSVYARCTGGEAKVLKTGGGTYARELPSAIAFGPTFEGMVTNIHNVDECISVENLNRLETIYYEAMLALSNR